MKMELIEPLKGSSLPRMLPLTRLVTQTSPAMQPVTATWPVVPIDAISSLWNSLPAALTIYPVLGVIILSLFSQAVMTCFPLSENIKFVAGWSRLQVAYSSSPFKLYMLTEYSWLAAKTPPFLWQTTSVGSLISTFWDYCLARSVQQSSFQVRETTYFPSWETYILLTVSVCFSRQNSSHFPSLSLKQSSRSSPPPVKSIPWATPREVQNLSCFPIVAVESDSPPVMNCCYNQLSSSSSFILASDSFSSSDCRECYPSSSESISIWLIIQSSKYIISIQSSAATEDVASVQFYSPSSSSWPSCCSLGWEGGYCFYSQLGYCFYSSLSFGSSSLDFFASTLGSASTFYPSTCSLAVSSWGLSTCPCCFWLVYSSARGCLGTSGAISSFYIVNNYNFSSNKRVQINLIGCAEVVVQR